jgi:hypothetical protein
VKLAPARTFARILGKAILGAALLNAHGQLCCDVYTSSHFSTVVINRYNTTLEGMRGPDEIEITPCQGAALQLPF